MINRNGLYYYYIIKRMEYLEKRENEQYLEYVKIVDRYQNKYNKSIFEK
jgi:guanylate kinase